MDASDKRYSYDRFGMKGARVGQAVADILSKEQPTTEVGEIIEEYGDDYADQIRLAVKTGSEKFEKPFYIVVLHKKEAWIDNVLRNWFVSRQSKPCAKVLRQDYPNHMHTVYEFGKDEELKILWSLPTYQDAKTIMKNAELYHHDLIKWIREAEQGKYN